MRAKEVLWSSAFVERLEHGPWHKLACGCMPHTFRDLANDIEEVTLLERELLGSGRAITAGGTDDLLRGKNRLGFET